MESSVALYPPPSEGGRGREGEGRGEIAWREGLLHLLGYMQYVMLIFPTLPSLLLTRGVLETLIRRHFPSPAAQPGLAGIDWSLIDNDPTLPRSCRRRRQRKKPVGVMEASPDSDSDDSSSPERSDSAVESSSDEGERSSEGSGSSSSESEDDEDNDVNPFGSDFSGKYITGDIW